MKDKISYAFNPGRNISYSVLVNIDVMSTAWTVSIENTFAFVKPCVFAIVASD